MRSAPKRHTAADTPAMMLFLGLPLLLVFAAVESQVY